jgi:hypothetical protein
MAKDFSQGFKDGYEDIDFKYDALETDKKYFDDYHSGKTWRNIHLSIFELRDDMIIDIAVENFQTNHDIAIDLMSNFTFD